MDIDRDDLALLTAARERRPGALRQLAVHLDQQLADEDRPLDGAVMAWQAVHRPARRTRTLRRAGIAGWLTGAARRPAVDHEVGLRRRPALDERGTA